tara:strand:- start:310 stop:600 length:291 start_codon:yes stop_codon:yes gene_type:complete
MKNIFLTLVSVFFLTGCAQNAALLGPAYSIASTGGIQQALITGSFNQGVKIQTGKNIPQHMTDSIAEKPLDCKVDHSNELEKIFFEDFNDLDCYFE